MSEWLRNLRKKPKHVRDNIAFAAASACTLPVLAYVLISVYGSATTNTVAVSPEERPKFFETLTGQFREQVATAREALSSSTVERTVPEKISREGLDAVPVVAPETGTTSSSSQATATTSRTLRASTTVWGW